MTKEALIAVVVIAIDNTLDNMKIKGKDRFFKLFQMHLKVHLKNYEE